MALEFLYLGHAYQGFARQADTEETIEVMVFEETGGGLFGRAASEDCRLLEMVS